MPNIRKLACVVPEKNVTGIFCDTDDDARRWRKTTDSDPYMSPLLKRAGDTTKHAGTVTVASKSISNVFHCNLDLYIDAKSFLTLNSSGTCSFGVGIPNKKSVNTIVNIAIITAKSFTIARIWNIQWYKHIFLLQRKFCRNRIHSIYIGYLNKQYQFNVQN